MFASPPLFRTATFVFVASVAASCSQAGSYAGGDVAPGLEAHVSVTNQNWSDVKVYAIRGVSKYRLGTVTSFTTERLRLPSAITSASDFRIRIELIGSSENYTTEVLYLGRTGRMDLVVNTHLAMSHFAIR